MKEWLVEWILWGLARGGNPGLLPWSFRRIRTLFSGEPDRYLAFLRRQGRREPWLAVFFAAHELGEAYPRNPDAVLDLLRRLSGHPHDMVRQGAARSWSRVLARDFERGFSEIQSLASDGDYERRQTAALAPVRYYDSAEPPSEEREQIRAFWTGFLEDPRSGLRNLVRTQILEPRTAGEDETEHG